MIRSQLVGLVAMREIRLSFDDEKGEAEFHRFFQALAPQQI